MSSKKRAKPFTHCALLLNSQRTLAIIVVRHKYINPVIKKARQGDCSLSPCKVVAYVRLRYITPEGKTAGYVWQAWCLAIGSYMPILGRHVTCESLGQPSTMFCLVVQPPRSPQGRCLHHLLKSPRVCGQHICGALFASSRR
jgi:hypothetical protein